MSHSSKKLRTLYGLLLAVVCFVSAGCSEYSTVSPQAYEYTKAIYSVCNRQNSDQLSQAAEQIKTARTEGNLSSQEADWLAEIISTAEGGAWLDATKDARQLMEAQVRGR